MCTAELKSWLLAPEVKRFPFDAVILAYHHAGKHFISNEVSELLREARALLPGMPGPWSRLRTLAAFMDIALDKLDNRYDYPSYLALRLLELPTVDDPLEQAQFARARCDRLIAQVVADSLAFEIAALDGRTTLLPQMRPEAGLVYKRVRHGLRAIAPALNRMALASGVTAEGHEDRARQVCAIVSSDMSLVEQRALRLSMLPVYTVHDEYLFLRVLQAFEITFAMLATHLRGAVAAVASDDIDRALYFITSSESALHESAPLFSMLATMQIESFRTFRQYTEGASAIQSRNYKIVEAICRRPGADRIDSLAYRSVPEVRTWVITEQQPTLDDVFLQACHAGSLTEGARERVANAMAAFAEALVRWRTTHYRLALRMLGDSTGTGYTEGTPYLAAWRTDPPFVAVGTIDGSPDSLGAHQATKT